MSLSSSIAPVLEFGTLLVLTIIFTFAAFTLKEGFWSTAVKVAAGMFWFVLAIGQFIFFGADNAFMILCLPFSVFGLLFFVSIIRDSISEKKRRMWDFED